MFNFGGLFQLLILFFLTIILKKSSLYGYKFLKIQNKKHAKVQNFMLIDCKILSLQALIFY